MTDTEKRIEGETASRLIRVYDEWKRRYTDTENMLVRLLRRVPAGKYLHSWAGLPILEVTPKMVLNVMSHVEGTGKSLMSVRMRLQRERVW